MDAPREEREIGAFPRASAVADRVGARILDHDRFGPHQSEASIIGLIKRLEPHRDSRKSDRAPARIAGSFRLGG